MYVNTAHHMLDLRHGAVAQSLLKAGGSVLQDECNRVVATRGTIPYWDITTTTGGNLQCQHIIHTVGQQYTGGSSVKVIERLVCTNMRIYPFSYYAINSEIRMSVSNIYVKTD